MSSAVASAGASLPLDGHETVLDKYMSELDLNNKQEYSGSPVRNEVTGRVQSWSVLGDPTEFEEMLVREELARREDEGAQNALSPVHLAFERHRSDPSLPEDVASALKDEEAFAPAIYKAYQDCIEEKSMLLSKVENLRTSRSQQLQGGEASVRSSPAAKRDRDGGLMATASLTGTLEREKEVQRRQTIGDKIIAGSQVRALQEYEKFHLEWADFKGKVSTKVGRLESDLVFERGPEFRRKKEELEMLELAIPTHERHGADQWTMSLRNNWTRYVPVGNIFSGLFCPVEDKPTIEYLEQITKPIHSEDGTTTAETLKMGKTFGSSTLASRGRSWLDSKYLQRRRTQYSKNIAKVRQHSVGAGTIAVVGESIEGRVEEQARKIITLKDVEEKLSQTNPAVWEMIRTNRQVREKFATLERTRALDKVEEAEEAEKVPKVGPYLECSTACLEFKAPIGEASHHGLELTNKGTTAVKYSWAEQKFESVFDSEKTVKKSSFFLSNPIGVILPGESKKFNFGFKPASSGQFWSKWELQTIPSLPVKIETLVLKGTSTLPDFADKGRLEFIADLKERIKERVTKNEMQRIVMDVEEGGGQVEKPSLSREEQDDRALFVGANAGAGYFYTPELFGKLKELFGKFETVEASEEPGEAGDDTPAAEADPAEEEVEGAEEAAQESVWDGSVGALGAAIDAGKLNPDADITVEEAKAQLESTLTTMRLPTEEGQVAYNAFYSMLCDVAGKIEEHLFEEEANPEEEGAEGEEGEAEAEAETKEEEADTPAPEEGGDDTEQAGGEEGGQPGEGDAEEEIEPPESEAKMAALAAATMALSGVDLVISEACKDLQGEFERQYEVVKAEADETEDAEAKEHLLWELFQLSRTRTRILGV